MDSKHAESETKLILLRKLMRQFKVQYYIIPHSDQHLSEYVSEIDERIKFISGFSGSAGTVIVGMDSAYLWTDGRYHLQADKEVDSTLWTVMKYQASGVPSWSEWIKQSITDPKIIGFDPKLMSTEDVDPKWTSIEQNIVDMVKRLLNHKDPMTDSNKLFILDETFSGESYRSKRARLMKELGEDTSMIVSDLCEIAWLLNLRGSDIECTPVFYAFMIVHPESTWLFVDLAKLTDEVSEYLRVNKITVAPYEAFYHELSVTSNRRMVYDKNNSNYLIHKYIDGEIVTIQRTSPIEMMKALKNPVEQKGFRACHIRDGLAKTKFLAWLSNQMELKTDLNEVTVATQLESFRKQDPKFLGLSFPTISSVGPNAAVIHYQPSADTCSKLVPGIYLCDSGAQYLDGTTDVTRTVCYGEPTREEIEAYTMVLKGHIDVGMAKFPQGTTGSHLDVLARRYLWADGKDYCHSTGHGVGHCSNVHESPPYIGKRNLAVPLAPGMVVSNEPGFYKDGEFGIRIESLIMVMKDQIDENYFNFETLTLIPMERKLIDPKMMDANQIAWLDQYHQRCWNVLSSLIIKDDDLTLEWLGTQCLPLLHNESLGDN